MRLRSNVCSFEIQISAIDGLARFPPAAHRYTPAHLLECVKMVSGSRFVKASTSYIDVPCTCVIHNTRTRLTHLRVGDLVESDGVLLVYTGDRVVFMSASVGDHIDRAGLYQFSEQCSVIVGDRIA